MTSPSYDISLKHPSTWIVSGATGSGKSVFTRNILENKKRLFTPSYPKYGVLFYRTWQPIYDEMKEKELIHYFYEGVPNEIEIKKIFESYSKDGGCFAIFDDLMTEIDDIFLNCFTVYSHHHNVTVILLVQSLFLQNKIYKECSLNSHYIVLMKNKRDALSVTNLAKQISPYHTRYVTESYINATKTPYSYLLFDMRQESNDIVRLRSNIFSKRVSIYVECSNNTKKKRK